MEENIVDIQSFRGENLETVDVAGGFDQILVGVINDDKAITDLEEIHDADKILGLDSLHGEIIDNDKIALLEAGAHGHRQRLLADLAVDLHAIITGLWSEGDAASTPQRRGIATCPGAAGPFLAPGLSATTTDLYPGLGAGVAGPSRGALHAHYVVKEVLFHLAIENVVFQFDLADILVFYIDYIDSRHRYLLEPVKIAIGTIW